ncbi:MAG: N-acetyltransferase [Acidimicrobiia bacterium]|nr:N-acetyltransferase [Acidimicrobiia bacterium]
MTAARPLGELEAMGVRLMGPVEGLESALLLGPCVLGHPTRDPGDATPLRLGTGVTIRAFAVVYQGVELGDDVQVGHGALVREGNRIGAGSSIGSQAELAPGNVVGDRCRIHSGCFLSSTVLGNDVFCGPHVVFTDDPHPPCPSYLSCVGGARVGDRVSIGAGSVVAPGVSIGDGSLVGAGSVVTRDVPRGSVVVGNPARFTKERAELSCQAAIYGRPYEWQQLQR